MSEADPIETRIAVARQAFVRQAAEHNALFAPRTSRGPRRGAARAAARVAEPPQRGLRIALKSASTREAYLSLAFHIPGVTGDDTAALDLAAVLLGPCGPAPSEDRPDFEFKVEGGPTSKPADSKPAEKRPEEKPAEAKAK